MPLIELGWMLAATRRMGMESSFAYRDTAWTPRGGQHMVQIQTQRISTVRRYHDPQCLLTAAFAVAAALEGRNTTTGHDAWPLGPLNCACFVV